MPGLTWKVFVALHGLKCPRSSLHRKLHPGSSELALNVGVLSSERSWGFFFSFVSGGSVSAGTGPRCCRGRVGEDPEERVLALSGRVQVAVTGAGDEDGNPVCRRQR